jgi:hypothetical protein
MRNYGQTKNEFYETSDLGVITALEVSGVNFKEIKTNGNRKIAVFENTQNVENIVNKYLAKDLTVDAFKFNRTLREVKHRLLSSV